MNINCKDDMKQFQAQPIAREQLQKRNSIFSSVGPSFPDVDAGQ
jgi:hypothetical protein